MLTWLDAVSKLSVAPEERWATISGCRMRYLQCGSGPPLLLIHGLLGYSFSWRKNFAAMAERSTVYAPDLLGCGYSDRPENIDCGVQACASRLLEFVRQLLIPGLDVLGTSYGGAVAISLAAQALESGGTKVNRLILVDTVTPWSEAWRLRVSLLGNRLMAPLMLAGAPLLRLTHNYFLKRMYADPRRISPGTLEGYGVALMRPGTVRHALRVLRCWRADMANLHPSLEQIRELPALLIWGSHDRVVSLSWAYELQRALPKSQLRVLQGVGHLPYEEAPGEFNSLLSQFMAQPC